MEKVILNIPHSSTAIPKWACDDIIIPNDELDSLVRFMVDKDVDKLWGFVSDENKQVATVSRLIIDTERYRNDNDEAMALKGMGLYYTHTPNSKQFRTRSEDTYAKCLAIYDEYHSSLEAKVTQSLTEHGECIVLDCHSFHDEMNYTGYHPSSFPDVCIGVNNGVDAVSQFIIDTFKSAGYTVKVNEPFAGSIVPLKYLNDNRVQSVMIELNRRIYDNNSFDKVSGLCRKIYKCLLNNFPLLPIAAQTAIKESK